MAVFRYIDVTKATRAEQRGLAFVRLFQSAKQLVDGRPGRFPYLEFDVKEIERLRLAPTVEKK